MPDLKFARPIALALSLAPAWLPAATGDATEALAHDRGCMSCHGMVRKQVGPGFAQIAARYRDDPDAASRIPARIRSGGVGTWGRVIMPRQTQVTEDEAGRLAGWILSQPSPP